MPEPEEIEEKEEDSDEDTEDRLRNRCSFLALAQRRTELVSKEVLHPLAHRVFGTPLLLRVADMEDMSGKQIYDLVAKHLRTFAHPSALKFLQCDSSESKGRDKGCTGGSEEGKTKFEVRQRLEKTMSDMEEVAAGPIPRYGFRLRLASRDGRRCALCPWYDCCIGCSVPDDEACTVVMNGDSIVIDWHFAVDVATNGFGTRGNQGDTSSHQVAQRGRVPGVTVKNHSSCAVGKKNGHTGAITLEDCLDAFAKEEKIPEVRKSLVWAALMGVISALLMNIFSLRPTAQNARTSGYRRSE